MNYRGREREREADVLRDRETWRREDWDFDFTFKNRFTFSGNILFVLLLCGRLEVDTTLISTP